MNSLSRRRFLKISGATIATAAVVTGSAKTIFKGVDEINKKSVKGKKFRLTAIYVFGNAVQLLT